MGKAKPIRPLATVPDEDRQVSDKPQRRSFTWEYKADILDQIEAVRGQRDAIGKILRREGLNASQIAAWRDEAIKRAAGDYTAPKRGRKPDPTKRYRRDIDKLEQENARLKREVEIQKAVIELQKESVDLSGSKNRLLALIRQARKPNQPIRRFLKGIGLPKSTFYDWQSKN